MVSRSGVDAKQNSAALQTCDGCVFPPSAEGIECFSVPDARVVLCFNRGSTKSFSSAHKEGYSPLLSVSTETCDSLLYALQLDHLSSWWSTALQILIKLEDCVLGYYSGVLAC